ncbi:hypothetical protein VE03_05371 [Pseudogymnoascus sp. 23342-1-I1]|nr:hypothetical protein VE03_05371 [Pseudogymnoascus sp. 23342-1-I1]
MNSLPEYSPADYNLSSLCLRHPTPDEQIQIWTTTAATWGDPLDLLPLWLQRFKYLTTIPLAKNGGMTMWILTNTNYLPDQRPILSSCDTFLKRSLSSDAQGNTKDNIIYGIASVFTPPQYRRRGYAARLMEELSKKLHSWQSVHAPCIGSILYSDIGRSYYTKLGWHVNASNIHYTFKPAQVPWPSCTEGISKSRLAELCDIDEVMIRKAMKLPTNEERRRVVIIPDVEHMLWHIEKGEFMSNLFLGKIPSLKGVIIGVPGNRMWAIWTHCYYTHPEAQSSENGLYILRLVVENDECTIDNDTELADLLKAILRAAQYEATEWKLDYINLWEPSLLVQRLIGKSGIEHAATDRKDKAVASGMWYDENGSNIDPPLWINNERYAYC